MSSSDTEVRYSFQSQRARRCHIRFDLVYLIPKSGSMPQTSVITFLRSQNHFSNIFYASINKMDKGGAAVLDAEGRQEMSRVHLVYYPFQRSPVLMYQPLKV